MKLLVVSLLTTVAVAHYNNASLEYAPNLNCESCIRGGYDYCDFYSEDAGKIIKNSSSACFNETRGEFRDNETTITQPGVWNETGYFCSGWFLNKINSIVNQCTP